MKTPRFTEPCEQCALLASDEHGDWYVCQTKMVRTVKLREGDEPDDFHAVPIVGWAANNAILRGALLRGLRLTDDEVRELLGAMLGNEICSDLSRYAGRASYSEIEAAIDAAVSERPKD